MPATKPAFYVMRKLYYIPEVMRKKRKKKKMNPFPSVD